MQDFKAGFGRVNITPMTGIELQGYYDDRFSEGVLDEIEANAVAFSCGELTQVFIALDMCNIPKDLASLMRDEISQALGLPRGSVHVSATHSHTTPAILAETPDPLIRTYTDFLRRRLIDVAGEAVADLKPSTLGCATGCAPRVTFIRRFLMKDGTTLTNPGFGNPDVDRPLGEPYEEVPVLRMDQEGGRHIILVNYANHADTIGGSKVSADWFGFARRTVEAAIPDSRCICFNGAEGDVSCANLFPRPGERNRKFYDYGNAEHIGRTIAGAVLQVYGRMAYKDDLSVSSVESAIKAPSNREFDGDLDEARRIRQLYIEGRHHELPYKGMELVTVVAEACRAVNLADGPDFFELPMSAVRIGNIGIVTVPGEAFTDIGRKIREIEGWDMILIFGLTDGSYGYFPVTSAYAEGGYEARGSKYKAGVAELIVGGASDLLAKTKE
ncbi:MAG: hypothetical protein IJS22_00955 [Lachnospiraceae bacterium]|nr:hypothetical protein [Lachnospiraceae bacterium]